MAIGSRLWSAAGSSLSNLFCPHNIFHLVFTSPLSRPAVGIINKFLLFFLFFFFFLPVNWRIGFVATLGAAFSISVMSSPSAVLKCEKKPYTSLHQHLGGSCHFAFGLVLAVTSCTLLSWSEFFFLSFFTSHYMKENKSDSFLYSPFFSLYCCPHVLLFVYSKTHAQLTWIVFTCINFYSLQRAMKTHPSRKITGAAHWLVKAEEEFQCTQGNRTSNLHETRLN